MKPKAHLFVVDDDTMPVHIQRGFCGIIKIEQQNIRGNLNIAFFGQMADIMNIKIGDLVYFYMQTKGQRKFFQLQDEANFDSLEQGYYGVFEVSGKPFMSDEEVGGAYPFKNYFIFGSVNNQNYSRFQLNINNRLIKPPILYVRIPIKPIEHYEDLENKFVDDNQAYIDKTDEGMLSTLLFKKIKRIGEERSITPILPEEASKIARLIFKQKKKNFPLNIDRSNLITNNDPEKEVKLIISSADGESFDLEAMLESYILHRLNNNLPLDGIDDVIGNRNEIEFCGNQIQYGISGNKVDLLLLHKKELGGSAAYRYKATVIELKRDQIKKEDITQIINYQKWVAQLTTFNNLKAIQPVLIGKKASIRMNQASKNKIKETLKKINEIGVSTPLFFEYVLSGSREGLKVSFSRYSIEDIIR
jgi:CRISPR/Cas system-associated exonuclease Cas4 (RecB family)